MGKAAYILPWPSAIPPDPLACPGSPQPRAGPRPSGYASIRQPMRQGPPRRKNSGRGHWIFPPSGYTMTATGNVPESGPFGQFRARRAPARARGGGLPGPARRQTPEAATAASLTGRGNKHRRRRQPPLPGEATDAGGCNCNLPDQSRQQTPEAAAASPCPARKQTPEAATATSPTSRGNKRRRRRRPSSARRGNRRRRRRLQLRAPGPGATVRAAGSPRPGPFPAGTAKHRTVTQAGPARPRAVRPPAGQRERTL
jgi:hypothetical protein